MGRVLQRLSVLSHKVISARYLLLLSCGELGGDSLSVVIIWTYRFRGKTSFNELFNLVFTGGFSLEGNIYNVLYMSLA